MPIMMQEVKSSNIKAIGYNPVSKELVVAFRNGTTYSYFDVPDEDYHAMLHADSAGQFFHYTIKGKFREQKMEMPEVEK